MEDHGSAWHGLLDDNCPLQTRGFPVPESFHEVQKGPRTNHSTIQRLGSNSSLQVFNHQILKHHLDGKNPEAVQSKLPRAPPLPTPLA